MRASQRLKIDNLEDKYNLVLLANRPNLQYELDRRIQNSLLKIIFLDLLITLGNY